MATYPPVTDAERDAAIARIVARHQRHDDFRWSEAGTEARDILAYLRRRHIELPWGLAVADVWDELVLSAWVYWDERRRERELLTRARRYGLSLADLGHFLGIGTRQGMRDYLDRLDALLTENASYTRAVEQPSGHPVRHPAQAGASSGTYGGPRAPGIGMSFTGRSRATRGADVHSAREARSARRARPARDSWINQQAPRVAAVITALLAQCARIGLRPASDGDEDADDLRDYLGWLATNLGPNSDTRDDHRQGRGGGEQPGHDFTPATVSTIGLVLGELRARPEVAELPRNHGLRLAMAQADRLRADYAELVGSTPPIPDSASRQSS